MEKFAAQGVIWPYMDCDASLSHDACDGIRHGAYIGEGIKQVWKGSGIFVRYLAFGTLVWTCFLRTAISWALYRWSSLEEIEGRTQVLHN